MRLWIPVSTLTIVAACSVVDRPYGDIVPDENQSGGHGGELPGDSDSDGDSDGDSDVTGDGDGDQTGDGDGDLTGNGDGDSGTGTGGNGQMTPLTFSETDAPDGKLGTPYTFALSAKGGRGDYTFEIAEGELPPGLGLSDDGVLSGMPSAAGDYPDITITVEDSSGDKVEVTIDLTISRDQWLAYASNKNGPTLAELFLVDISNNLYAETNLSDVSVSSDQVSSVEFSPDGRYLAFILRAAPAGDHQLFVTDISGTAPSTPEQFDAIDVVASSLSWSPDGRYLAYAHAEDNRIYFADFAQGVPADGQEVGVGLNPAWASDERLVYSNLTYDTLNYVVVDDGETSPPQSLITGATLNGMHIVTDVGSDDVIAIRVPLDPCYEENYLVDFNELSFDPIGVSDHAGVYFSPDASVAALNDYDYAIHFLSPPGSTDAALLSVRRPVAASPATAASCDNGAWSPDSQLFASVDNDTRFPWIADFTAATPDVHDVTGDTVIDNRNFGPGTGLYFLDDRTLLFLSSTAIQQVTFADGETPVKSAFSSPGQGSGTLYQYAIHERDIVAYAGELEVENQNEIYLRRRDGGGIMQAEEKVSDPLGSNESYFDPTFSGDGGYLLYRVQRSSTLISNGLAFVDLSNQSRAVKRVVAPVNCALTPCTTVSAFWTQP